MPRCRKEKKIPYRTDDMVQNVRSSFIREGENNLRNYSEPVDDRMKDAYDRMKPSNMYNDMSNKARNIRDGFEPRNASPYAKNLMGDLPTTRNIRDGFQPRNTSPYSRNLMGDLPTTRNIRDGFEPRNASPYSRNLMGDLPVPRHNRETYEPHYIPVKLNRSNNLMNNVSEPRNIRDGFEPRNASPYSRNLMGDLPVPRFETNNTVVS
ncbi:uncharacterized protein DC041_0006043 [Schistosoma bovis]|uniref:Uncharacterized protein n=1 Tax=Schistosoma bovis TaxID=6184 RepID=A0A430QQD0_SCHBO|nr:uncharacterized protein DC041_0006043 [Schistosoma bovis]